MYKPTSCIVRTLNLFTYILTSPEKNDLCITQTATENAGFLNSLKELPCIVRAPIFARENDLKNSRYTRVYKVILILIFFSIWYNSLYYSLYVSVFYFCDNLLTDEGPFCP